MIRNLIDTSRRAPATRGRWHHLTVETTEQVEESRTVEHYSRSEKCKAKEIINSPPPPPSGVTSDESLIEPTVLRERRQSHDCPAEEEKSLRSASEHSDD